jgi:small-conductance mechanosensitive channel
MGNYEDHVRYGHAAYALLAIALVGAVASGGLSILLGGVLIVAAYPLARLGAAFPDIDHHASKPHHALRKVMFVVGTIISLFVIYTQPFVELDDLVVGLNVGISPEATVALLAHGVSLLIGLLARESVSWFRPKHRGITHRVPTGVAVTGILAALSGYVLTTLAVPGALATTSVLSVAFFVGFLSHLQCDGMLVPALRAPLTVGVRLVRRVGSR